MPEVFEQDGLRVYRPPSGPESYALKRPEITEKAMRFAMHIAQNSPIGGDLPIGAALIKGRDLLSLGHARDNKTGDESDHAERVALKRLAEKIQDKGFLENILRSADCVLVCTFEPCDDCFSAIEDAGVPQIVYAAHREETNQATGDRLVRGKDACLIDRSQAAGSPTTITGGFMEEEGVRIFGDITRDYESGIVSIPIGYSVALRDIQAEMPFNMMEHDVPELSPMITNGQRK